MTPQGPFSSSGRRVAAGLPNAPALHTRDGAWGPAPQVSSDQAAGLRQRFVHRPPCFVALLSNPQVATHAQMMDLFCSALIACGRHVLLVDGGESAPAVASPRGPQPQPQLQLQLQLHAEALAPGLHYLPARHLLTRQVDLAGQAGDMLPLQADACPQADAVVVHAPAAELARVFRGRLARPVVLGGPSPQAITHAYAGIKLMVQRAHLLTYALLLAAAPQSARTSRIARQMGACADTYLGAVLSDWTALPAAPSALDEPPASLKRLALHLLQADALSQPSPASAEARPVWAPRGTPTARSVAPSFMN
jgi:hypothetical protein